MPGSKRRSGTNDSRRLRRLRQNRLLRLDSQGPPSSSSVRPSAIRIRLQHAAPWRRTKTTPSPRCWSDAGAADGSSTRPKDQILGSFPSHASTRTRSSRIPEGTKRSPFTGRSSSPRRQDDDVYCERHDRRRTEVCERSPRLRRRSSRSFIPERRGKDRFNSRRQSDN